jgi:endonuclease YncB( thermonuclease family)
MRFYSINRNTALHSLVLTLGLLGCPAWEEASVALPPLTKNSTGTTYRVKRIADGDTITVVDARGVSTKVRFACIDSAPFPIPRRKRKATTQ